MNKSLLKILVATVAVSATVATTVFAVRKLKKNKTKDKETVNETVEEEAEEAEVETAEKEAEETANETVTDDEENKEEEKNNTKEEKEVRKDKKKKDKKNKKKNKKNKNKKMTKEETNKAEEVKEAEAETTKEEVTEEKTEDTKDPDETNDNLNSDDVSDIELKIKQCMEKPLTDEEKEEDAGCYSTMTKKRLMNEEKTKESDDFLKEYRKYSKNKYVYLTENHFKKLPEVTSVFIKSLTKEERKYENLLLEYFSIIKNFHRHVKDTSDLYSETFKMMLKIYSDKFQDTIDKSNSNDKENKKNLINKYNKFLLDDFCMHERTFDVANMFNGFIN